MKYRIKISSLETEGQFQIIEGNTLTEVIKAFAEKEEKEPISIEIKDCVVKELIEINGIRCKRIIFDSCIIKNVVIEDSPTSFTFRGCVINSLYVTGGTEHISMDVCHIKRLTIYKSCVNKLSIFRSYILKTDVRAEIGSTQIRESRMRGAEIRAKFGDVNIASSDLYNANIKDIDIIRYAHYDIDTTGLNEIVPEHGSFIGYKKCLGGKIVTLLIPEEAKRSSATSNKCRASKAKVIAIENANGKHENFAHSIHYNFTYQVGETIEVDDFDENRWKECAPGIHFFLSKKVAKNYL